VGIPIHQSSHFFMSFDMQSDPFHRYLKMNTPLGDMVLGASPQGLTGAWFLDQRHRPPNLATGDALSALQIAQPSDVQHLWLTSAKDQLSAYFEDRQAAFDLAFDINGGTEFQQLVWRALTTIPFGQGTSYGALARQIGKPAAVRAVGAAVGRNPLGIFIPCHRVVGANRSLTGYAGGLHRKTWLLRHEGWMVGSEAAPLADRLVCPPGQGTLALLQESPPSPT
jgi:methylated-DNA-[protein]-cysteine S-methyltransferase